MKETIRMYALGLLTATLILGFVFMTGNTQKAESKQILTANEKIASLKKDGYHILSEKEYTALTAPKDVEPSKGSQEAQEAQKVYVYSLDISPGTTTPEISSRLKKAHIITDEDAFNQFMKDGDYSRYIQLGQVTVNSTMSEKEIAEAITSK